MIPFPLRLTAAVALLLLVRRPWARAASAIVAVPAIYWPTSYLTLLAFAPLIRDRRLLDRDATSTRSPAEAAVQGVSEAPGSVASLVARGLRKWRSRRQSAG
jgi:hypothetical protein